MRPSVPTYQNFINVTCHQVAAKVPCQQVAGHQVAAEVSCQQVAGHQVAVTVSCQHVAGHQVATKVSCQQVAAKVSCQQVTGHQVAAKVPCQQVAGHQVAVTVSCQHVAGHQVAAEVQCFQVTGHKAKVQFQQASDHQATRLQSVQAVRGNSCPSCQIADRCPLSVKTLSVEAAAGSFRPGENRQACTSEDEKAGTRGSGEDQGNASDAEEDFEVEVPVFECWDDFLEGFKGQHHRLSVYLQQQSRRFVHCAVAGRAEPEELALLRLVAREREDIEWRLKQADLDKAQLGEVGVPSIRSLGSPEVHYHSQPVLHTRLVSNEEVRENLTRWAPAMAAEYHSLLSKGAIEEVSNDQVKSWLEEGKDIEVLPGRGVPTEKPPSQPGGRPREKYSAVICGNFQKVSDERASQSYYAGGADSISIRTVLRWARLHGYGASGVDIKTAFLNAPVDSAEPEYLICSPPRHMVAAGVVPARTKWRVKGALYGLVSSPRSWSVHRDKVLKGFSWSCDSGLRRLQQCVADPNVWKVLEVSTNKVCALVTCYVDDILAVDPLSERKAFLEHLSSVWDTSAPEHTESTVVTYCGLEIASSPKGLRLTQTKYIGELLQRHPDIQQESPTPYSSWKDSFEDTETKESVPDPEGIKMAQSLTGEALWLVMRSRPELSFAVNRMSQLSTKRPHDAISIGKAVLRFLKGSTKEGLLFGPASGSLGSQQQLTRPETERSVTVYSDASFAPGGGRSCQGIVVHWAGAPIHWEASRQTLTALSTAESELTSLVCSVQAGQAVAALLEEISDSRLDCCLYGDSQASLAIAQGPTSWRTRHLRIRSSVLRDLVQGGEWTLRHLAGELLPADLLTKALPPPRFRMLMPLLGVLPDDEVKVSKCQPVHSDGRFKKVALALWIASLPHLLNGCADSSSGMEQQDSLWVWLLAVALGVILLWEGSKAMVGPALRALVVGSAEPIQVMQISVSMDQGSSEDPTQGTAQASRPITTRNNREDVGNSKGVSSSGGASQAAPPTTPPPSRALSAPATSRIPARLTAHFTATGERWHQDQNSGDIRGRITSRYLPCQNCTVGRLPVIPPDVPQPPSQARQRRRYR